MVPRLGSCELQHRRRKEHGLIVGMRYQETDALVAQGREPRRHDGHGVQVAAGDDDDQEPQRQ